MATAAAPSEARPRSRPRPGRCRPSADEPGRDPNALREPRPATRGPARAREPRTRAAARGAARARQPVPRRRQRPSSPQRHAPSRAVGVLTVTPRVDEARATCRTVPRRDDVIARSNRCARAIGECAQRRARRRAARHHAWSSSGGVSHAVVGGDFAGTTRGLVHRARGAHARSSRRSRSRASAWCIRSRSEPLCDRARRVHALRPGARAAAAALSSPRHDRSERSGRSSCRAERASEAAPNFIHELIEQRSERGPARAPARCARAFRRSPTATCTSATPRAIVLNFGSARRSTAASATCASTTPIRPRKSRSTSTRSSTTCAGSAIDWDDRLYYASDYFEQLYAWAEQLIQAGKAYVDESSAEELKQARGDFYRAGQAQSASATGRRRRASRCSGACAPASSPTARWCCAPRSTWRSGNLNLRDPAMYRILHAHHHRTGDAGASTRCTTTRTASRTRSRASRTRCARSSSRTIARSTTGSSSSSRCAPRAAPDRVRASCS